MQQIKTRMQLIQAENLNEATDNANSDSFIASGCKSFEIRTLKLANEENNYLLAKWGHLNNNGIIICLDFKVLGFVSIQTLDEII
ncbi:hypothetical protein J14TS5_10560 [Paenibacillus lautus]|nr:hypothetical protein J14TS5_10560 [Paenibacillus lautus]